MRIVNKTNESIKPSSEIVSTYSCVKIYSNIKENILTNGNGEAITLYDYTVTEYTHQEYSAKLQQENTHLWDTVTFLLKNMGLLETPIVQE